MSFQTHRFVEALARLRLVRESKQAKDLQLIDIMVLMHFLDGKMHTNSEIAFKMKDYVTNPNAVFDATSRLAKLKGLLDREVDPYNSKVISHALNRKGMQLMKDFLRDMEDCYVSSSKGREVAS